MLGLGVEEEAAFELPKVYSGRHNLKLNLVAERILSRICDPAFSRDKPVRSLLEIVSGLGSPAVRVTVDPQSSERTEATANL